MNAELEAAFAVFYRAAGDEITAFVAQRGARLTRKSKHRRPVTENEILEAARVMLRDLGSDLGNAEEASTETLMAIAREAIVQSLEEWWQKIGSESLTKPDKRRQMWFWIQSQMGGTELQPAP